MKKLCVLVLALAMLLCATSALAEAATNALTFTGLGPSIQVDTPITAKESPTAMASMLVATASMKS